MSYGKGSVVLSAIILFIGFVFIPGPNASAQKKGLPFIPAEAIPPDTSVPPPDYVPVEKEPQITKHVTPAYPELARKARVGGRVVLKIWVDKNGVPRKAAVLQFNLEAADSTAHLVKGQGFIISRGLKVPYKIFNKPAIDAAMKYRFTPAISQSRKVAVWVVIPFSFKLKPDSVKAAQPGRKEITIISQPPGVAYLHDSLTPPPSYVPVSKEPKIVKQWFPVYPSSAAKHHLEGRVYVKIWVTASGTPHQAIVLKSSNEIFNKPSVDAAMKYRFAPAFMNGKPVPVWVVLPFTFKLKPDTLKPRTVFPKPEQGE